QALDSHPRLGLRAPQGLILGKVPVGPATVDVAGTSGFAPNHRSKPMPTASQNLKRLIEALAPYWAAEAEIVRPYFSSSKGSSESDLLWLAQQCRKEFWDGFDEANPGLFIGPLKKLLDLAEKIDQGIDRHQVLDMTEGLHAEFAHYCAFADAYDAI